MLVGGTGGNWAQAPAQTNAKSASITSRITNLCGLNFGSSLKGLDGQLVVRTFSKANKPCRQAHRRSAPLLAIFNIPLRQEPSGELHDN